MYYALEDGRVVYAAEDKNDVESFITQRLSNNPKIGATIRVLMEIGGFVNEKTVRAYADDPRGSDADEADNLDAGAHGAKRD